MSETASADDRGETERRKETGPRIPGKAVGDPLTRALLDAVSDAVLLIDADGVVIDANPRAERLLADGAMKPIGTAAATLLGFRRGGTDGDSAVPSWPPPLGERIEHTIHRARPGGSRRIDLTVTGLENPPSPRQSSRDRSSPRWLAVMREVDDATRELRDFADASSDWMWETDRGHRFTRFIGDFRDTSLFAPDLAIGMTRAEMLSESVAPEVMARHMADLEARRPIRDFVYAIHQPGRPIRHMRVNGRPFFDADGVFQGYRGTTTDITDGLRAEERATNLDRRMSAAISAMSEGVVVYDDRDRIVVSNHRYRDTYPDLRDVILPGTTFEDTLRAGVARGCYDLGDEPPERWIEWRVERHRKANGAPFLVALANGAVIRISERPVRGGGVVGIHSDVTEELMLRHQLETAKVAAEAASAAKSEFLAVVSHEIRTPMNGVIGMTGLLLETDLSATQRRLAITIRESGESLLAIINDILDFSKIEAGRMDLEHADFDVAALVTSVVELLSPHARAKDIGIGCTVAAAALVIAEGDAGRVRQILTNLIGNAIKFTECGRVGIEVDSIPVTEGGEGDGPILRFAVTDTGVGIEADAVPSLFTMFEQVDRSATRRHSGTGLGLAISRRLARMMGGDITVVSTPGVGSTFTLTLPLPIRGPVPTPTPSSQPPASGATCRAAPTRPLRVLVVEDNAVNQEVARGILRHLGHTADIAGDGIEALEAVTSRPYDVVLMDVRMPRLDGLDATRRIRAMTGPVARIPIVAMTANAMRGDAEECMAAGMDDFLPKPVNSEGLAHALSRLTGADAPPPRPVPMGGVTDGSGDGSPAVLDPAALDDLLDVLGIAAVDRLMANFRDDAPRRTTDFRAAVAEGRNLDAAREAHSLKGAGGSFGLTALTTLCARLEAMFKGEMAVDPAAATSLEDELNAGIAAVDGWRADKGPK